RSPTTKHVRWCAPATSRVAWTPVRVIRAGRYCVATGSSGSCRGVVAVPVRRLRGCTPGSPVMWPGSTNTRTRLVARSRSGVGTVCYSCDVTGIVSRTGEQLTTAELYELLRLRVDVFVVEQRCPYPELDGNDLAGDTQHFWTTRHGRITGCLRTLGVSRRQRWVSRVCTGEPFRGAGVAASVLRAALAAEPRTEHVLHAQTRAAGLYERFGFRREGEPFDEDGIPHITMRRQPSP